LFALGRGEGGTVIPIEFVAQQSKKLARRLAGWLVLATVRVERGGGEFVLDLAKRQFPARFRNTLAERA